MSGSFAPPTTGTGPTTYSQTIPFTDGDTSRRVTISNGVVTASSLILGSIIRPTTIDGSDRGYIYKSTVISRGSGTFDILVAATNQGFEDPGITPPNETVTFVYTVG